MGDFTYTEKVDMRYMYGLVNGSGRAAPRMYHAKFPDQRMPDHRVFQWLHRQRHETPETCLAQAKFFSRVGEGVENGLRENKCRLSCCIEEEPYKLAGSIPSVGSVTLTTIVVLVVSSGGAMENGI
ncbi:hypothetical protein TNCV_10531 [Trichonephila clavipes]|nr:hypothetical protein TNCV_10531 [Trichonephila clavipes]